MREQLSAKTLFEKPVVFRLNKKREKPALKGRHYPSMKVIPSEEIIFDPKTGKSRTMRYAIGEPSIFKDEQPDKVVLGSIILTNGSISINRDNPELIQFLTLSNLNSGNPNKKTGSKPIFSIVDNEAIAEKNVDQEIDAAKAVVIVSNMDFDDMKAYARVLGVDVGMGAKEIRHEMIRLAKKQPDKFIAGIDDPLTKRQQVILNAREIGLIAIDNRSVSWKIGDNKKMITPVPTGQDATVWFAEWTMTDKDGEGVIKEIEKKLAALSK